MRTICIINQKGGVGKTTTAVNIASGLSRKDKKVLLVDMDPQGNIADSLTSNKDYSVLDFLMGKCSFNDCTTRLGKNLDLIHSTESLTKFSALVSSQQDNTLLVTHKFRTITQYDYIIFDCSPSLGLLNQNVMRFCKECLIPVRAEYLSKTGLGYMVQAVDEINKQFSHSLAVRYIVPTQFDKRVKSQVELLQSFEREFPELLTNPIRINSKLAQAPAAGKSIFSFDPTSRGAKDYGLLVEKIVQDEPQARTFVSQEPISARIQRLMADVEIED